MNSKIESLKQSFTPWSYKDIKKPVSKDTLTSMIIAGSSASGKSFFLKDMMRHQLFYQYDACILFCKTDVEDYRRIWGKKLIHRTFMDMTLINKLKKHNEENVKKVYTLVVFDDMGQESLKTDRTFLEMWTLGRHSYISPIFLCQYYAQCPTTLRSNSHYQILFATTGLNRESLIKENLLGLYWKDDERISFKELDYIVACLTCCYNCIVIKKKNDSIYLSDVIYYYKVGQLPPYQPKN